MQRSVRSVIAAVVMAVATLTQVVYAGDLKAPFDLESAQVLPARIGNPRFKSVFMSVSGKLDGFGNSLALGDKLNKVVSWQDIKDAQSTDIKKTQVDSVLADPYSDGNATSAALDPNGSPGQTTGQVTTFASVMVPVLAYGATDRLTMGLAVPIMSVQVNADTGFIASRDGRTFLDGVCSKTSLVDCAESAAKLNDAVNQKLSRLGYEPIRSRSFTHIGDMKLLGKYLLYSNGKDSVTLKGEVTAPTGLKPDPDKALDVPTGDGQWDFGLATVWDHRLYRTLTFDAFWGYTWQTPDSVVKRLPTSVTDSLSADKELLDRNLGDIITMGSSLSYEIPDTGVTLGAGYNFQFLTRTTYSRGGFEAFRYDLLEAEAPSQSLHSMTLTAGFSTVGFFRQKKFPLPFQANLAYGKPLMGRNVTDNSVISAELVGFF